MDAQVSVYEVLAGPKHGEGVNSFFLGSQESLDRMDLLESPTHGGLTSRANDGVLVGRNLVGGAGNWTDRLGTRDTES